MRYMIEGKVHPERIGLTVPKIQFLTEHLRFEFWIVNCNIFVIIDSDKDLLPNDARNIVASSVQNIVDIACFNVVLSANCELNSFTNIDSGETFLYSAEGYVFQDLNAEKFPGLTFKVADFGEKNLEIMPSLARTMTELRRSIRDYDFTALHCYLAIESISNNFLPDRPIEELTRRDHAFSWAKMRENLRIRRSTIDSFKSVADIQRHGRNVFQSWEQRQTAMVIAWECTWRYINFLRLSKEPLSAKDFPEF